ncbi:MAG: hypothetical protein HF973_18650 [Chloroflexi bacterium]|nr:hypothetical protein [Chloroflexota bacterium]
MQLTIEVPEKDLVAFGQESVQREIVRTLRWMKIRQSFKKISAELSSLDEQMYFQELEAIRASTWDEYKQELT